MLLLLIDLLLYYITKWRIFCWIASAIIIVYLSALVFVIGMYIPIIGSLL